MFKIIANNVEAEILLGKPVEQKTSHYIVSDDWKVRSVGKGRFNFYNYRVVDFTRATKEIADGKRN